MKVAVIGSRSIGQEFYEKISDHMPVGVSEIISGGAIGADTLAALYAKNNNIKLTVFYPDYGMYGRQAPLERNALIVNRADYVIALWDGKSGGTRNVILSCLEKNKPVKVIMAK
ncbi:MAG: SLOG family protein [Bacillota bacterium]|nr:SLOG family protein [Bacillota bacterium]